MPGLRVEAWDKDLIFNDLVGSAITDEQGAFEFVFSEAYFRESSWIGGQISFFKVFREDKLIKSTEDSVLCNVENIETPVVIEVDITAAPPRPEELFVVQGQIRYPDGKPFTRGLVKAFDKDMRSEECLGETIRQR